MRDKNNKNLIIGTIITIAIIATLLFIFLSPVNCKTDCKYMVGETVIIKNKTFNDKATINKVICGCKYEITYYSIVMRHRRIVEEYEIRKPILGF